MDRPRAHTPDGGLDAAPCAELSSALSAYAQGELGTARASELRAHLVRCPACAGEYRRSIEGQARRGRGLRGEPTASPGAKAPIATPSGPGHEGSARTERTEHAARPENTEHAARPENTERADVRPSPAPPKEARGPAARRRRLRLRTLVLPALFIWLFLQVAGVGNRPARIVVESARGEVTVAERPYASYERPPNLGRGIWCHTREGGSATLLAPGARLVQDPWSSVQAEIPDPLRVRLRAGGLVVEGRARVVTWIGIVDFEGGAGRVSLVRDGLELTCASGTLEYAGPLGARVLTAGDSVRLTR